MEKNNHNSKKVIYIFFLLKMTNLFRSITPNKQQIGYNLKIYSFRVNVNYFPLFNGQFFFQESIKVFSLGIEASRWCFPEITFLLHNHSGNS